MPALENFRNSLTQNGILLEGSVLPPNNPDWEDDFRACFTPTGLKIAGGGGDYTFEDFVFTLLDGTTVTKSLAVETSEGA